MSRTLPLLLTLACTTATGLLTTPPPASAAAPRNPVVFVHGYQGSANDMATIRQTFLDAGYRPGDLYALDYPDTQTNETTARQVATLVNTALADTGRPKADLIGYSMGSLSARYYLKNLGGTGKIAHFASIAGVNHGTVTAYLCGAVTTDPACPQMAPTSAFLTQLNADDETPGETTKYATWASRCDTVVIPITSARLDGAANHWTRNCPDHTGTLRDPAVQAEVVALFRS
ncbi:triacylglycerol lipase [Streptomyces sp. XD-27]|uniref:esterase/lipase family protein n=1 Tax=Streptomyces sp. XD-27 TaxID=3062779 RepID=UPI0026F45AD8|nr:alpha/beta fold hydrolase [Streptomyces sp. XD-27]WKX70784.1 alpha/beta fold hydrolase [Streptomyces sp. XD-27]